MVGQQDILDLAEAGIPFRPARARGLARGLRVVEGEPSALARARALRARTGQLDAASEKALTAYGASTALEALQAHRADLVRAGWTEKAAQKWYANAALRLTTLGEMPERLPAIELRPLPELTLDVLGPEGQVERTFRRRSTPDVRFSPEASAEQELRGEAMRRHATERQRQALSDHRGDLLRAGWSERQVDEWYQAALRKLEGPTEDPRAWFADETAPQYQKARELLGDEEYRKLLDELGPTRKGVPEDIYSLAQARLEALRNRGRNPEEEATRRHFESLREQERLSDDLDAVRSTHDLPPYQRGVNESRSSLPPDFLDRFENQHGWRPRSVDEALAMLTDDQIRELSSPSFWGPEEP